MTTAPLPTGDAQVLGDGGPSLVVMLGPDDSTKSTQSAHLAETLSFAHVSAGAVLRHEVQRRGVLGQRAADYLDTGRLIPDHRAAETVAKELARHHASPGVVLQEFPRTMTQAVVLERLRPAAVQIAVALVVPRVALLHRFETRHRADVVRRQLVAYERENRALLSFYSRQGVLVHVDGHQTPAQVTATILRHLRAIGVYTTHQLA